MRFPILLALLCLPACNTVDDLRAQPIVWTATYPTNLDAMANCLAVHMAEDYAVTPQIYPRERRAVLTGSAKGSGPQLFVVEYSVRQISETESEVGFRSVFSKTARARALADRCGRGA